MKRRSQLKRGKGPRRKKSMRNRRGATKYARRERQLDYMLGVKQLPCAALIVPGHECEGPIEADHAGARGMGQKAADSTVIPLCQLAHRQRTDFSGPFKGWNQAQMRDFLLGRIIQTQRAMLARGFLIPASELAVVVGVDVQREPVVEMWPPVIVRTKDSHGRDVTVRIETAEIRFAEDLREEGNVDVRHPDAAPLPAARVVTEGDHR